MLEWMKGEMNNVSSRQCKFSIKINLFCLIFGMLVFIPLTVYTFYHFAGTKVWWVGFIPLFAVLLTGVIFSLGITWLYKKYKNALQIEKEKEKENEVINK